jgi:glycogen debranching enzyme
LIQSLYPAGSAGLLAVQREFEYFSRCGWDNGALRNGTDSPYVSCTIGAGGMVHRLASNGFYNAPWGALQDQNPHFIIGVHALATATGDAAAARRLLPAVQAVADYLEANGLATTGIFTSPASGLANGGACPGAAAWEPACGSSNWFDVVLAGHFDGYNALLSIWALECLEDLMAWLGEAERSAHYGALHTRAVAAFNELMWSQEKESYADWVDAGNTARYYFFTDVQFKAVFLGVANASQAALIMARYDTLLEKLVATYNATLEDVWGPPSNVVPITNPLEFVLELEPIEPVSSV